MRGPVAGSGATTGRWCQQRQSAGQQEHPARQGIPRPIARIQPRGERIRPRDDGSAVGRSESAAERRGSQRAAPVRRTSGQTSRKLEAQGLATREADLTAGAPAEPAKASHGGHEHRGRGVWREGRPRGGKPRRRSPGVRTDFRRRALAAARGREASWVAEGRDGGGPPESPAGGDASGAYGKNVEGLRLISINTLGHLETFCRPLSPSCSSRTFLTTVPRSCHGVCRGHAGLRQHGVGLL